MATLTSPSPILPKFIPLAEAVKKSHLSEKALRDLLQAGKISGGEMIGKYPPRGEQVGNPKYQVGKPKTIGGQISP